MTTIAAGRLGGQYGISLVTDDIYKVHGHLMGNKHTIGSGSYEDMTKLMDYCVQHDGQAQEAMKQLFFEGDPSKMVALHEAAQTDPGVRARKRVALVLFVATDVLESENAIPLVTERVAAAMQMAGVTVMELSAHYATDITPQRMKEQLAEIDTELNQHSDLRGHNPPWPTHPLVSDDDLAPEPAVQTGAAPLVSDPSDRDNVQQAPITRPNK